MQKLVALIAIASFTSMISLSAQAESSGGWSTQAGPLVQCEMNDGSTEYIPTLLCTAEGGSYDRNPGNQF